MVVVETGGGHVHGVVTYTGKQVRVKGVGHVDRDEEPCTHVIAE
jgi:hypothetical protein